MEPTECTKAEPPPAAAAAAVTAPPSTSVTTSQQSSMSAATDASAPAPQRNHPDASNGNSAFAVAAAATPASASAAAKVGALREDRPSASTAVEHKVSGDGAESEVKECRPKVNSERAAEVAGAARSDSAGNNNFPKRASIDEEKAPSAQAQVPKQPTSKGKMMMTLFLPAE